LRGENHKRAAKKYFSHNKAVGKHSLNKFSDDKFLLITIKIGGHNHKI
jgi:hypothetical protein